MIVDNLLNKKLSEAKEEIYSNLNKLAFRSIKFKKKEIANKLGNKE